MGTEKRERQKANREQRKAELARQAKRAQTIQRVKRIGTWVLAAIVIYALLFFLSGGSGDGAEAFRLGIVPT